jgi:hypothetical protein
LTCRCDFANIRLEPRAVWAEHFKAFFSALRGESRRMLAKGQAFAPVD